MNAFTAFLLTDETKRRLLVRFPQIYPHLKADHITHRFGGVDFGDLHWPQRIEVIGMVDDRHGLQALLVAVDGQTRRPDGGYYHITWSLDQDALIAPFLRVDGEMETYESRHSNNVIAHYHEQGDGRVTCRMLDDPMAIVALPGMVRKTGPDERVIDILPQRNVPRASFA